MDITYNLIKPLIVDVEVQGQRVFVEFQQPDSGNFVEAQGPIRQSNSVGSAIGRSVKRTAMQQARSSITRMVGSLFGGGFLGRTARAATSTAASEFTRNQSSNSNAPSESEIEDAVVAAFKTVRTQFHYDEGTGTWGKPKAAAAPREKNAFETQIDKNPIVDRHDRKVFARILADLASADGVIQDEEVEFFQSLVPTDAGSIHDIIASEPVSKVDCEMVKDGVRDTIYIFSWAIVMADYEIHAKELEMMAKYGDMLGISASRKTELEHNAKIHMLEQALNVDISREDLFELADSLNLNHDDAERAKIAWVRRQG
ncbi:MAG: TerB family tellurite resistance protein [Bacteroidetes bacterium]|nr:TerB family tellurite resistance protein [Bacteroidota bacterium]MBL0016738.1 TerB family tellurite resistance protein [Bacteroidota bacterium]